MTRPKTFDAVTDGDANRHSDGDHDAAWVAAAEERLARAQAQLEAQRLQVADHLARAVTRAIGVAR